MSRVTDRHAFKNTSRIHFFFFKAILSFSIYVQSRARLCHSLKLPHYPGNNFHFFFFALNKEIVDFHNFTIFLSFPFRYCMRCVSRMSYFPPYSFLVLFSYLLKLMMYLKILSMTCS
jgi:hypothetical protein